MDNKTVYKKTLTFSLRRLAWDLASFVVIVILAAAGFLLAEKLANSGLIGLAIGIVIGIYHDMFLIRSRRDKLR